MDVLAGMIFVAFIALMIGLKYYKKDNKKSGNRKKWNNHNGIPDKDELNQF